MVCFSRDTVMYMYILNNCDELTRDEILACCSPRLIPNGKQLTYFECVHVLNATEFRLTEQVSEYCCCSKKRRKNKYIKT